MIDSQNLQKNIDAEIAKIKQDCLVKIDDILFEYKKNIREIVDKHNLRQAREDFKK